MAGKQNGSGRKNLHDAVNQQQMTRSEAHHAPGKTRAKRQPAPTSNAGIDEGVPLPSQAEGERQPTQQSGADTASLMDQSATWGELKEPKPTPSQAEGERETIDEDLREKGIDL